MGSVLPRFSFCISVPIRGVKHCPCPPQVPQWCAEHCLAAGCRHGAAVCSQTHGQLAVQLALRAADEMDLNVGHEVGYFVPFESCCTTETILRLVCFSPLTQTLTVDPQSGWVGRNLKAHTAPTLMMETEKGVLYLPVVEMLMGECHASPSQQTPYCSALSFSVF